jgi:ubiquinone biosynthesis protein COQ4
MFMLISLNNDTDSKESIMNNHLPLIHPNRPRSNFRPFKAMKHFRKLIADKEDTEQVFHITNCLRGKRYVKHAAAFLQSGAGTALQARKESLPDILDDHDALWKLPAGSLGRAYVAFMEREGLTANGLVEESKKYASATTYFADQLQWYNNYQRDTHDMHHILTGYGRDPLGEQCVLAFSYSQNFSLGFFFIAYAGGYEMKRRAPSNTPIFSAIREAQRNGANAKVIGHQDITALLHLPLEEVRAMLNIAPPAQYEAAHAIFNHAGVNPHDGLAVAG